MEKEYLKLRFKKCTGGKDRRRPFRPRIDILFENAF